jgi:hypothetical protein
MGHRSLFTLLIAALLLAALPLQAEFFCQRYDFAQEKWIRLDAKAGDVQIQDIQFEFPTYVGPRRLNIKGRNEATVNVKNYGAQDLRVHIAVALFDASGNLVGCGTTGSKLGSTKAGEQETFYVTFDYVHSRIATAKTFYLTVDTEPVR